MRVFGKSVEVKEHTPGVWYVRFTHTEGGSESSEFLKFRQKTPPTPPQIRDAALSVIFTINNPPALIPLIPELAPEIAGLNASQQVTLNLIWTFLKIWLRQLIGRQ